MLTYEEARQRIVKRCKKLDTEEVALDNAQGRVLQESHYAAFALPPWDNSAMDGYALRQADIPGQLRIDGVIAAGHSPDRTLAPNTCLKIMTGAPLPAGANAVVMREEVQEKGELAFFKKAASKGQHIRQAGEDVEEGSLLIGEGTVLQPGELAILAAQGIAKVKVTRKPRVVIISTGNELVPVGTLPKKGQIVNSNAVSLAAQVREAGGIAIHAGILGDTLEDTVRAFRSLADYDLLVSSGGVSMGDYDYVKKAYRQSGIEEDFWKVAIKPGKPVVFGHTQGGQLVFGLPGNPASSLVTFELFVRPAIRAMCGHQSIYRPIVNVRLSHDITKNAGRTNFMRAQLQWTENVLVATALKKQGSGMLRSMLSVDAFLQLHQDITHFPAGDSVPAILLRQGNINE